MSFSKKACRIAMRQASLFILLALPGGAASQEAQTPAIRVEVSRVNVGVIATDRQGKFVERLQQSDFHIFDNGVEQPIAGFLANDDPAQVILMLECGPSVNLFGAEYVQKADALIRNLAANDRVAILCYTSTPAVQFELNEDKSSARRALRELNFHMGFGDLNLSRSLLAVFDSFRAVPGKKTVVVLSSGVDSSPPRSAEAFHSILSDSEIRVLAVSTTKLLVQPAKHHKRSQQERASRANLDPMLKAGEAALQNLASATGGRVYFPKSPKEFDKTFLEIAQIVRHEYNLAFVPQNSDGRLHALIVTASHAHRVDHRQAYLAPASPAN